LQPFVSAYFSSWVHTPISLNFLPHGVQSQ
jgi:hypothetical protein